MPPKAMSQDAIERLITQRVNAVMEAERERRVNARGQGGNVNEAGGQGGAPAVRECTFSRFMKCNPMVFHGHEGAVELSRWFEKTEMVFRISECAEARKVKFAAATLQGRALTWWNSQVATRGLEATNQIGWTEMKRVMTEEFCPIKEIQRMEYELWNLKVKDFDYTQRFHELVQLYPEMVLTERKKIEAYIQGLTDNIKGTVIGSKPTSLNEAVRMTHALMEQKSNNIQMESFFKKSCYENEVSQSVFNCNKCDSENPTLHKRLGKTSEMKAVPPPMTGNYFPSIPDIEIDDSPTLLMGSRGNTTMPELYNKMELLRDRNRNLIEAGKDHALQIYFFLKHFLGLKQLVMLVMDLKKEDESAQDCFELPIWNSYSSTNPFASKSDNKIGGPREEEQVFLDDLARLQRQEKEANEEAEALRKNLEQETENLGYSGRKC
ncbi:putative reverse transcriptase domain-containing protein [Tanacetum coccineum]